MSGCDDCIHEKVCGMADAVREENALCPDLAPRCSACAHHKDGRCALGILPKGCGFCSQGAVRVREWMPDQWELLNRLCKEYDRTSTGKSYPMEVEGRFGIMANTLRKWRARKVMPDTVTLLFACDCLGWRFDHIVGAPVIQWRITPGKGFAENLKALMKAHGDGIADLAKAVGVGQSTVSMWRNGRSVPRADALGRLCRRYGVSARNMFKEEL